MQAQPSGRLSDSDVFAVTHAESASKASRAANKPSRKAQPPEQITHKPALLQLQDLAAADAITLSGKATPPSSSAVGSSPQAGVISSPDNARANAEGQQLPVLSQLRALAGVADSPQMASHMGKFASELTDLASVPLSQWQFGNNGTAHAVWQADSTPNRQPAGSHTGFSGPDTASAHSSPGFARAESAGMRASSPTWGPSEPPEPVHLSITVVGDGDGSDKVPGFRAESQAGSVHSSLEKQSLNEDRISSFGLEAGYGAQPLGVREHMQGAPVIATAITPTTGEAALSTHSSMPMAGLPSHAAGDFTGPGDIAHLGIASHQTSLGADTDSASAALHGASLQDTDAPPPLSQRVQSRRESSSHGLHPVGSAGADELAEAAAQMAGSPWDPQQGPKLLESLSDFSSFNSSLSMLQQLAGKSAAGLATLGIASPSSSSQRKLEKKKSDKGHLISSAPTPWWKRRPGSAKKSLAAQVRTAGPFLQSPSAQAK